MEKLASKCVLAYIPLFSPARCRQSQLKDSPYRRSHARRSRHSSDIFPAPSFPFSSTMFLIQSVLSFTKLSIHQFFNVSLSMLNLLLLNSTIVWSQLPLCLMKVISLGINDTPLLISGSLLHISGSPLHISDSSLLTDVAYRLIGIINLVSQMSFFISVSTFPLDVIHLIEIVPYLLDIVLHLILINPCHSVTLYISPEFYLISLSSHHTSSLSSLSSSRRHDCSSCSDYSLCHQHRFSSTHHGVHTSHLHRCSSSFPWYHSSTHSPIGVNLLQSRCGSLMRVLTPPVRRDVQPTKWKTSKLLKKGRKLNRKYMRLKEERKQRIKKSKKRQRSQNCLKLGSLKRVQPKKLISVLCHEEKWETL